jgi:hypothetical protein
MEDSMPIDKTPEDLAVISVSRNMNISQLAHEIGTIHEKMYKQKSVSIEVAANAFLKMDIIAFLCGWSLYLMQQGISVNLTGSGEAIQYLARMDFNHHIGIPDLTINRKSEVGRFIPIKLVESDEEAFKAVNAVCELAIYQFDQSADFVPAMEWAVNEVVDNIRIHSQSKTPGIVCAQYYPQRHRMDVAVCDMGIGLKTSLDAAPDYSLIDHKDAITHAITRGITRDSNIGQGNGMAGTVEIAKKNGGEFHIWTGDSLLNIRAGDQTFEEISFLPGAGVLFSLDTKRSVDLSKTWIGQPSSTFIERLAENTAEQGGINVQKNCATLGSRPPAKALRRMAVSILTEMDSQLVLDFTDVRSASSSFLDELLGRLVKELGETAFKEKIKLQGMNNDVRNIANVVINQRLHPDSIKKEDLSSMSSKIGDKNRNAWLVILGKGACLYDYVLTINSNSYPQRSIDAEDFILIADEQNGNVALIGFGRVFRKRYSLETISFYFDGYLPTSEPTTLDELNIPIHVSKSPITRLSWAIFETAFKTITGASWTAFPIISGDTPKEQAYVRELMQTAIMDDILGPADGPMEEIIGMSVRDRYLVGKLAPQNAVITEDDELPGEGAEEDQEGTREVDASTNQSLVPSSFGFTFCVDSTVDNVELLANWGRYERTESERLNEKTDKPFRCWKRIPSGGSVIIQMNKRKIEPIIIDNQCPEVIVQGSISSPLDNHDRLVTLFFINNQSMPKQNQDQTWVFQPEMIVRDPDKCAIFRRRPVLDSDGTDAEREALEMIYRNQVEFAVGHGVSVHATSAENDSEHAVEIRTSILPEHEVPVTETPGLTDEDRPALKRMISEGFLDMENLAELDKDALVIGLKILTEDYALWISEQRERIGKDVSGHDGPATAAMDRCSQILGRLEEGIETLGANEDALEAFHFTNRAMSLQRIRSIYALSKRRGENPDLTALNIRKNRSWRPFQLAFILLSLPALADPEHRDRTEPLEAYADLLWFPTGGGKTEAYLGVATFTMAIRRLQDDLGGYDGSRGLSVIMRYTLRLLTLQQFQRASTLICALENVRRGDPKKWGNTQFTIGLWVGNRVTPGSTEEAHQAIQRFRDGKRYGSNSPAQFTTCPWCGSNISEGRDIEVKKDIGRTFIYCGDKYGRCDFSRSKSKDMGLPVLVVDEEIYRHPPTILIATVDKFAMMAWRGQVRTLFGRATQECCRHGLLWPKADCAGNHNAKGNLPKVSVKAITPIRPPDLIIQDEFHLISGPLGTMVGLYETAVDELSTWQISGKSIRPKVIASTATVRKADQQVNNVFLRQVEVFPPHGLDVEDNFFSVQRPINEKPGRRYMGICSLGSSRPAVLIRVYVAMLTAAQSLFDRFGQAADPYMTVVGYFNSLRELGGMRRLAEDDVQTRAYRVQMSDVSRPGLEQRSVRNVDELTSRVLSKDIPKKLDQLEVKFKANLENGKYVTKWDKGETRAIDIVLATNMLSVGVDVNRLGIMAVNGQPKNTAEYIQATSRVGRSFPGLVCTVLTWSRPRDLSHYETFEHYHATFYKHVEAQSVTPFAPRALDRGLTGTLVSLVRLGHALLNPNLGAMALDNVTAPELIDAKDSITSRAWKVTSKKAIKNNAEIMISDRADRWVKESRKAGRRLGYETERRQGDVAALLKKPGGIAWDEFTVPMSMREVEPGVKLIMDIATLPEPPTWKMRKTDDNDGGES